MIGLFQYNSKPPVPTISDGLCDQVFFGLNSQMNHAAFSRIQHAEGKRRAVFTHLIAGETGHCLKFGFSGSPVTVGVNYKAVIAVELAAVDLKQKCLERIEHFAVFGQGKMSILTFQIQQAAFVSPLRRDFDIEAQIGYDLGQKLLGILANFVNINCYEFKL